MGVGLDTGLRRSNLVGLQWTSLQERGSVLVVPRMQVKAKKRAVVIPLTRRAAAILLRQPRTRDSRLSSLNPTERPTTPIGRRRAGLADVSLHVLRHTFISRLVQAGRPLPEVSALAGHRDITMTMRYAHLGPRQLREGIDALESRGRSPMEHGRRSTPDNRVTLESRELAESA